MVGKARGARRLEFIPTFYNSEDSYSKINWVSTDTKITNGEGETIFEKEVMVPFGWSELATRVVASKYLVDNKNGVNETHIGGLVSRVGATISHEAVNQKLIYRSDEEALTDELKTLTARQYASFNSPVWFNEGLFHVHGINEGRDPDKPSSHWVYDPKTNGFTNMIDVYEHPQDSACFIQSISDDMDDILEQGRKEGLLFKYGSGTGTNFSPLRGYGEPLSRGGIASGQISFLGYLDHIAKSVRSGGKTRRAAKMVISDCDHPDIFRFIDWKVNEEKKALWLCANPDWGPRSAFDLESEAYKTVNGQNGNNSVRVSDAFMHAVENDEEWDLKFKTAGKFNEEIEIPLEEYNDDRYLPDKRFVQRVTNQRKVVKARDLWEHIARAAYVTGDPALQYHDNINKWNTCANSGEINASNPCSEFMFLNDSSCNLASLNLMKFRNPDGSFNVEGFKSAVRTVIIAQETIVDHASYPSEKIARNSHDFRPLGLGYGNMGAFLMSQGVAYDSNEGRRIAGAVTSLMTAEAYKTSAEIASKVGAFNKFEENRDSMLGVIAMHKDAATERLAEPIKGLENLFDAQRLAWDEALALGEEFGYRNAQVTLLAPTGTIGFMMDYDTTGIEPMTAITSEKGLVGGGKLKMKVAKCVRGGLEVLGYEGKNLEDILEYANEKSTLAGAPGLKDEHVPIFATAIDPNNNISVDGHLNMMAWTQPFLSGAISKTVNLPRGSTLEDIKGTYRKGWELGLKSVALYVDGSKGVQPITVKSLDEEVSRLKWGDRLKPTNPIERLGWNVDIQGTGVHVIVGEYKNRKPSEAVADAFVAFGSSGSPLSASYTSYSKELSRNRQRGGTMAEIIKHNLGASGTISGQTDHPNIKTCSSIEDFLAKFLKLEYLGQTDHCQVKPEPEQLAELRCNVLARRNRNEHYASRVRSIEAMMNEGKVVPIKPLLEDDVPNGTVKSGTPFCTKCGKKTILSGANCYKCDNCGHSPGCG